MMGSFCSLVPRRYCVALFLFFGCFNLYTLRQNLSIGIQPMSCEFKWSNKIQGMILSSFFFGYLWGNIPGGVLATKYGGKLIFGFGIISGAFFSLFIPFIVTGNIQNTSQLNCKCSELIAENWCFINNIYTQHNNLCNKDNMMICNNKSLNIYYMIALRILMGLCQSVSYPALFSLINNWSPSSERSIILSICTSGIYIANSLTFTISSAIINNTNWFNLFYYFSFITIIWYILYLYYVYDKPFNDPLITKKELKYLKKEIPSLSNMNTSSSNSAIPWKEILTNRVIISIYCCHFAYNWTFYTLLIQLPTYLNKELNYNLSSAGFISIMPYIGQFIIGISSSIIVDKIISLNKYNRSTIRKIAATLSTILPSLMLIQCVYIINIKYIIILLIVSCSSMGFGVSGWGANFSDISQDYSSIIVGVSNTIATLPGVISPLLTGYILENKLFGGWKCIFYICFLLNVFGTSMYWIFGHANPIKELNKKTKYS